MLSDKLWSGSTWTEEECCRDGVGLGGGDWGASEQPGAVKSRVMVWRVEDLTKVFVASEMLGFSGIIQAANTTSNSFDNVRLGPLSNGSSTVWARLKRQNNIGFDFGW